jgi:hypothetical protein
VHIQLEAVGSRREAGIEGSEGVLGPEGAAAAVREDERTRRVEEAQDRCPCRMMSISGTQCLAECDMNVG